MRAASAAILIAALRITLPALAATGLEPGAVLDQTSASAAEELLPPETLAHYRAGEYRNAIGRWPAGAPWEDAFTAASQRNAARLDVDSHGTIVARDSGKPAVGIYGLPFRIDPADPAAGVKAVWNAYYALWRTASSRDVLTLAWVGHGGREREAVLDSQTLYWEGAPPGRTPKENPLDLASQQRAVVTRPADLNGTASLTWRFRGADKRDQAWIYVPALRRVRQVSPANRSDGFLGSDLSQDDGGFFDGKPEDFTWKLAGERDALVLADPGSLAGQIERHGRPDGTIEEIWPADQKVVGFQDPAWRGVPWAPLSPVLVRRKLWIVEAVPHDSYYLYSKIEIALDQETFQGARSRKFDAQGALLRSLQFLLYPSHPVEAGGDHLLLPGSSMIYLAAENTKSARATVVAPLPGGPPHERRGALDPGLFVLDRLGRGK